MFEGFRGEVLAACDKGRSTREAATSFNGSESGVRRVRHARGGLNKVGMCLTGGARRGARCLPTAAVS